MPPRVNSRQVFVSSSLARREISYAHLCTRYSRSGYICLSPVSLSHRPSRWGQEASKSMASTMADLAWRPDCRELRKACLNKDELGEVGQGNCRRYRRLCGRD